MGWTRSLPRCRDDPPAELARWWHSPVVIPVDLAWLFWDVDPGAIDLVRHRDYVIERVMTRGDWYAMRWLVEHVEKSELAAVLRRRGHVLTPRGRAFWSLMAGIPSPVAPGGGRPTWAG